MIILGESLLHGVLEWEKPNEWVVHMYLQLWTIASNGGGMDLPSPSHLPVFVHLFPCIEAFSSIPMDGQVCKVKNENSVRLSEKEIVTCTVDQDGNRLDRIKIKIRSRNVDSTRTRLLNRQRYYCAQAAAEYNNSYLPTD